MPPSVKVGEDVLFNLDAFYAAHAWRMTERSVYGYDLGGDSAMTRADAHVYESAKPMLQGITAFIRKNGLQTALFPRAHRHLSAHPSQGSGTPEGGVCV